MKLSKHIDTFFASVFLLGIVLGCAMFWKDINNRGFVELWQVATFIGTSMGFFSSIHDLYRKDNE